MQRSSCYSGCFQGANLIAIVDLTAPLQPRAPPDLTPLNNRPFSTFRAGAYAINLTAAMPTPTERSPPLVGFLFQVEDMESQNITYLWQVGYKEIVSFCDEKINIANMKQ